LRLGDSDILDRDRKVLCYLCLPHCDSSFWYNWLLTVWDDILSRNNKVLNDPRRKLRS
jgi:hypothetical protein